MLSILNKIITLAEARIPELMKNGDSGYSDFYKGSQTFIDGLEDEIREMKEEIRSGKRVFLEDELGDVFWDYICLLENLEKE